MRLVITPTVSLTITTGTVLNSFCINCVADLSTYCLPSAAFITVWNNLVLILPTPAIAPAI